MIAPHINSALIRTAEVELTAKDNEKGLYLVAPLQATANEESRKLQMLEEKMRQAHSEIARLEALLSHKEQLLQNFRVREWELKAALFQANARGYVPL